jgi:N-methylhydantoinase A
MQAELGAARAVVRLERSADLRYAGQSFEINVPAESLDPGDLAAGFHARHERRYGHAHPGEPLELVTLRVRAAGLMARPAFESLPRGGPDPSGARVGERPAWFGTEAGPAPLPTPLYDRERLLAGMRVPGPAILFQMDATTVVPPGWSAAVDDGGHLLITHA